jgi:hypothetical protein
MHLGMELLLTYCQLLTRVDCLELLMFTTSDSLCKQ